MAWDGEFGLVRGTLDEHLQICEFQVSFSSLSEFLLVRIVETYALVVDDLNDGCDSGSVWAGSEESDTANLDRAPAAGSNVCVTHCVCVGVVLSGELSSSPSTTARQEVA